MLQFACRNLRHEPGKQVSHLLTARLLPVWRPCDQGISQDGLEEA